MKLIKICRISTVPFSMVSQLMPQIECLCKNNMDVTLVSSYGKEIENLEHNNKSFKYKTIEIDRNLNPVKDILALFKLIVFFRKNKFDIVHSITPKAGLLVSIASFISNISIRLHTWTGQPWVNISGLLGFSAKLSDRLIGKLNTKCYADSLSQRDFLIKNKIILDNKISVIGKGSLCGVNINRFSIDCISQKKKKELRKSLGIHEGSKVIIFIGRITKDKGIIELLRAFKKLYKHNENYFLLIVGPSDVECGGGKTIEKEIHKNIIYTGYTKNPEYYLSISTVLCLPSYREGFGTVVIEAASMGIPAIGTDIYGLKDAIINGVTGELVPPRDIDSLYNSLKELLSNDKKRNKMGKNALERCREHFDSKILCNRMYQEYLNLLSN